jgi:hypothetical protein
MNGSIIKLTNFLTGENSSVFIHLILYLALLITIQWVWHYRKLVDQATRNRLILGLGLIIFLQSINLLIAILYLPVMVQAQLFPAILERTIAVAMLISLIWLWLSGHTNKNQYLLLGLLLLFTLTLFIYTLASQNQVTMALPFNGSWFDILWQIYSALVALSGILLFVFTKPKHWIWMFIITGIHLTAFMLHFSVLNSSGNYSALVRLAQLVTFPLLPGLMLKCLPGNIINEPVPIQPTEPTPVETLIQPHSENKAINKVDYPVLYYWTSILEEEKPEKILIAVCRALANTLKADLCYIISCEITQKDLLLQGGYDLIREVEKTGGSIKKNKLPLISKAVENSKNLQLLLEDGNKDDITALTTLLNLESETNVLVLPMGSYSSVKSAVLLLSPYSKRVWSEEEQHQVQPINQHINKLFENISRQTQLFLDNEHFAEQVTQLEIANQEWQEQNQTQLEKYQAVLLENEQLRREIEANLQHLQNMVEKSKYDSIVTRHQQNQHVIEQLNNNNDELKMQLEELKHALFEIDPQETIDGLTKFDASTELESMLAIQLESQEVISRLYQENQVLQNELEQLSSSSGISKIIDQDETNELFEIKKNTWLEEVKQAQITQNLQIVNNLKNQMDGLIDFCLALDPIQDEHALQSSISLLQHESRQLKNALSGITFQDQPITFPQLLDEIFESLNAQVIQQDLTLRVDIPEGMNDVPIQNHKISHLLKTLLRDLVHSLQQDEWLSIKIERQDRNLIIHISMGCSEVVQSIIIDILNAKSFTLEDLDTYFGLILTKNLVESIQGMVESTQNTAEQTNLFIRLPIESM